MKDKKFDLTSVIIAFISVICAIGSRYVASSANTISERMLQIEENRKLNENKEKSLNIVNSLYDKIMYTPGLYDVYLKIQNGKLNGNEEYFWRFVDEFEGLGAKYCQEQVYLKDIKGIKGMLKTVCTDKIIKENVEKKSRNTFSKVCFDVVGKEGIGSFFNGTEDCKVL